ncbi:DUF3408 domain-containing protein [Campylobacter sp. LR291e]|nr:MULTISPECIES: DUF3408 domain-containing protein [unclassified Campylobacter]KAA6225407.1 DUF3408 domain-containing protein [Campylobacter sp. LR185c]KAA6227103.1 DUF3408 domain-containing protein [Campylobacter sp. LR196d]KAA6228774.1 DUF3408 domain-containing protein [Campylobacter sp. LR286c]KAA6229585.1 DUF3408 domain-containing protein [Campylobacter sp. LR264d]KAA6230830.1 DUF3408 domain-containing protein [Campylobacter sp. LR291e]
MVGLFSVLALFLVLSFITYFALSDGKKRPKKAKKSKKSKKKKEQAPPAKKFKSELNQMIEEAANRNNSDSELKQLAKLFLQKHKLGSKTSKTLDDETKNKLEFISALASNTRASAGTISFLNQELKRSSNSYRKEIDAYEQMGLAKRKIKENA